ncbi:aminotransferase class I/II-fold pyridoxal phosphate-dependent enzyme [[Clostridium] colinum]|uniref:aminotransferase class I/II-fold pyridoxal phosphate-dependent enzyme n=1 Tax=[Clostridium] colinum TaxID=36835 RepID=UPI0020240A8A|nr:aminotransferase class I/II-fold pyridoxal phosphate-dependent enzyme [[Clostridium] colinum]
MSLVSKRIQDIPYSGIRKFFDIASEVEGVISLGVGEPDFNTPWTCTEKAIYTLEQGKTTYTSNAGMIELREEISKYMKNTINVNYCPKTQVLVTVGASEGIDLALRAVICPEDEVLVVEPSFVSYKPCITMCGGIPIVINTKSENNFKLTPEDILSKLSNKTKAIIMSYPNNPTGAIMEKDDLEKIANILKDKNILVISDEIYSELTYENKKHISISQFEGMYEKTVVLNGFSKSFAMTGWRLGFAVGPKDIISAMTKIHQYVIMCAPTMSQYAGLEALTSCIDNVNKMRKEYNMRRKFILNGFREMGLDCFEALGAFYVFPCIKSTGLSSQEFCERLVYEQKVAVVPGTAFGECGEGYIRCSYAYSIEKIKEALFRIKNFLTTLK